MYFMYTYMDVLSEINLIIIIIIGDKCWVFVRSILDITIYVTLLFLQGVMSVSGIGYLSSPMGEGEDAREGKAEGAPNRTIVGCSFSHAMLIDYQLFVFAGVLLISSFRSFQFVF